MKYIKTFESSKKHKRYIIADFRDANTQNKFYMFKTIECDNQNDIRYDRFWFYDKLKGGLETIVCDGPSSYIDYKEAFDIIFETNSHRDALDALEKTENIEKFNL